MPLERAMKAACYLVDCRVCLGIRKISLDSRYAVRRSGGALKLNALARQFFEEFRGVCGGEMFSSVPPIQAVVAGERAWELRSEEQEFRVLLFFNVHNVTRRRLD